MSATNRDGDKNEAGLHDLYLSYSVKAAVNQFSPLEKVHARAIVKRIIDSHSEYGDGKAGQLDFAKITDEGEKNTVSEWLHNVRSIYDDELELLDGRLVILGLSILDQSLGKNLYNENFITGIQSEIEKEKRKPITLLLTKSGYEIWNRLLEKSVLQQEEGDIAPIHPDDPAVVDLLGRKLFAKSLALYLKRIRGENDYAGAFFLHIYGEWGSGKTTMLNFLSKELAPDKKDQKQHVSKTRKHEIVNKSDRWVIVWFNAWEHQRAGPVWWSLMDSVYSRALEGIPLGRRFFLRMRENMWRIRHGFSYRFFWPVIIVSAIIIILLFLDRDSIAIAIQSFSNFLDFLENRIGLFIASVVAVITGILALSNSLLPGAARAAREFVDLRNDPMTKLKEHYRELIGWINRPVAIFIDDLDRCQPTYTVELLERIQTLFNKANVIYVIAADRRWIYTSYEMAYNKFRLVIDEPGRPLRFLFLEKTFQISVPIPRLDPQLKQSFWEYLLKNVKSDEELSLDKEISTAEEMEEKNFEKLNTEREIREELKKSADNPLMEYARRGAAIARLADLTLEKNIENKLIPFGPLMEPNPRFMKRVVNHYRIAMSIELLTRGKDAVEFGKLALWTILSLRWPRLAEYLELNPNMITRFKGKDPSSIHNEPLKSKGIPKDLFKLFSDTNVFNVIMGNARDVHTSLDYDTILKLSQKE